MFLLDPLENSYGGGRILKLKDGADVVMGACVSEHTGSRVLDVQQFAEKLKHRGCCYSSVVWK